MNTDRLRLKIYLVLFMVLFCGGVSAFVFVERLSWFDAAYFSIVTMATVGYGDIHPQTSIGKIVAMVMIIGGVSTFLGVVASITEIFIKRREEAILKQKLNMVAGLFFSEMGNQLLRCFAALDPRVDTLHPLADIAVTWNERHFNHARELLTTHQFGVDGHKADWADMESFLQKKADLLLRLLENPALQEHGHFADLLRAIFHLRDELANRMSLADLAVPDRRHLEGDVVRIYRLLAIEWLEQMRYLKQHYGYLLSLAVRLNPFNPHTDATVQE